MDIIFNGLGIIGVALVLGCYFSLEKGILKSDQLIFPILNLIGATLILISLFWEWNLPSVIYEVCWIIISIYGIRQALKKKAARNETNE